jgi:nitrogen fixation NifU-like protein|tara:strand:+ start:1512 stop:1910 length:399 start_codon:yes stop_codon:yes gene_type:complete
MDLEILKIASNTENHKILTNFSHSSKQKNPLCGDEMQISLKISNNKILDFAYQCKSCIYCQASASVLSRVSINNTIDKIRELVSFTETFFSNNKNTFPKEWKIFNKLFNKKNVSRKECLMLPFKTLAKALKS